MIMNRRKTDKVEPVIFTYTEKFCLDKALKGCSVVTRDGRKVDYFECINGTTDKCSFSARIEGVGVRVFPSDGRYIGNNETHNYDLFLLINR